MTGVSVVVPVHNGERWLRSVVQAIGREGLGRPFEILAVDDRSTDASPQLLEELKNSWPLRVLQGEGKGAAAAINMGLRAAAFPLVAQIDQDVVVSPGWLARLVAELDDPGVAAAQGYYATDRAAPWSARVMGLDLESRYAALDPQTTDHVCTGNVVYRADALRRVGLFDERLGYGYDNDMSYRLRAAGYRLTMRRDAESTHHWRTGLAGYCAQQYGFGYGRLELLAKHPRRIAGDAVSPASMMLHPVAMAIAVLGFGTAAVSAASSGPWRAAALVSAAIVALLSLERLLVAWRTARRFGDRAAFGFPVMHLLRDATWVVAIAMWCARRLVRHPSQPTDSMPRRGRAPAVAAGLRPPSNVLGLILAHNEAAALPTVIEEVRACCPDIALLVVDDGSTDATSAIADELGVRWLRLPERVGVGRAMRAGLRYAARLGFDTVVRLDGDGQHRADHVDRVLAPLRCGVADVVIGSRFAVTGSDRRRRCGPVQRVLGFFLTRLTGGAVTDPTSGFFAMGPRAVRMLADHHPTGYPEPELRLFLSRNGLSTIEVPVVSRQRIAGRSSLTPVRLTTAAARVLLAMIIVPLRDAVGGLGRD